MEALEYEVDQDILSALYRQAEEGTPSRAEQDDDDDQVPGLRVRVDTQTEYQIQLKCLKTNRRLSYIMISEVADP